jgi:hypothetical protein
MEARWYAESYIPTASSASTATAKATAAAIRSGSLVRAQQSPITVAPIHHVHKTSLFM